VIGGEAIVIVRPAPRDKFGDPVPGGQPVEATSGGWLFAPGGSTELLDGQNSVDWDVQLYRTGPPGAEDIRPADQVRVRGELFEVVGEPAVWRLGTVISLRRFTG
jgi:hypothetical protein